MKKRENARSIFETVLVGDIIFTNRLYLFNYLAAAFENTQRAK
jgi:hypothetical protein